MTACTIDVAQENDGDAVLALVAELLQELGAEGREYVGSETRKVRADLTTHLASGSYVTLLARDNAGEAVGVITISQAFAIYAGGEYGVIDEMYVRPAHRGHGIGRQLLARAVELASERGWGRLSVTAPQGDIERIAARFYERHGFSQSGEKLQLLLGFDHAGDGRRQARRPA